MISHVYWVPLCFIAVVMAYLGVKSYVVHSEAVLIKDIKIYKIMFLAIIKLYLILAVISIYLLAVKYYEIPSGIMKSLLFGDMNIRKTVIFCLMVLIIPLSSMFIPLHPHTSTLVYEGDDESEVGKDTIFTWLRSCTFYIIISWTVLIYFYFAK